MLRREIAVGESRFRRIYRQLHLQVRAHKKRKAAVTAVNQRWSIDFMHDRLANGRTIRTMNIVDDFSRECLAIDVGYSFASGSVIRLLELIGEERGLPQTIRFDNGTEFTSRAMLQWGADHDVALHFIDPGKPTQNAIESLNGRIRDELMNAHSFANIFVARRLAGEWRTDYNDVRPHSALGYLTPREFADRHEITQLSQLSVA